MANSPTLLPLAASGTGSPVVRAIVRFIGERCLRWFYRDYRVLGADRAPASGPVILIGNHPNDLPDVLLGYRTTARPLRYLATVSGAASWPARKTYEGLGVIPVLRVRDARKLKAQGVDLSAVNRQAGDAVAAALAEGSSIGVFPEGGVHDVAQIGNLRTGAAKMILSYLDAGANNDVQIVPFGVQYEAPRTPRSDVLVVVGEPFSARAWRNAQPPEQHGLAALTHRLETALRTVTRNAPTWAEAEVRDQIVAAVAAAGGGRDPLGWSAAVVAQASTAAANLCSEAPAAEMIRLQTATRALSAAVMRAGGIATSAMDHARLLVGLGVQPQPAPVPGLVIWMGVPAALIGWVAHGPVFALLWWLAHRTAKAREDLVAATFLPGVYIVTAWYLLLGVAVTAGVRLAGYAGWLAALAAVVTVSLLPAFGDLAVGWRSWFEGWRLVRRVERWSAPERETLRGAAETVQAIWGQMSSPRLD
jgi:1-acyl-sn-glycerol-3-phosphate acyltransferase